MACHTGGAVGAPRAVRLLPVMRLGLLALLAVLAPPPTLGATALVSARALAGSHTASASRQGQGLRARLRTSARATARARAKAPASMTPLQFLIMSAPREAKVCYTAIRDFTAVPSGFVSPLVDTGLTLPSGLALDKTRGFLYVADPDAGSIYRYKVMVMGEELITDGVQLTVVSGREPRWVSVDMYGDLYITDQGSNAVYKLPYVTIQGLEQGTYTAADLRTVSEAEEEALVAAQSARSNLRYLAEHAPPTPEPEPRPIMITLYEASLSPHIARPSGIVANGIHVFWGNEASGTARGSVVEGNVLPVTAATAAPPTNSDATAAVETEPASNPSRSLAMNAETVFGVTMTHNAIIYTDRAQYIYGVPLHPGPLADTASGVVTFTDGIEAPRGIVWDGDGTVYVADQGGNAIYSFPCGRLAPTSVSRVVDLHNVFGLALFSSNDPAYVHNQVPVHAGAPGRRAGLAWLGLLVAGALAGALRRA